MVVSDLIVRGRLMKLTQGLTKDPSKDVLMPMNRYVLEVSSIGRRLDPIML